MIMTENLSHSRMYPHDSHSFVPKLVAQKLYHHIARGLGPMVAEHAASFAGCPKLDAAALRGENRECCLRGEA